ncbi:MAG TPA: hypothetical protein VGF57_06070 [Roseiarcus sp.]|jgi:hypothetical protein
MDAGVGSWIAPSATMDNRPDHVPSDARALQRRRNDGGLAAYSIIVRF